MWNAHFERKTAPINLAIPDVWLGLCARFSSQTAQFHKNLDFSKWKRAIISIMVKADKKYFEDQLDDEELIYVFRKHPVVMRRGLIYAMIAIVLGTIPSLIKPEYIYLFGGLAGGFLLAGIIMLPFWVGWHYSVFIVTDQRLIQITQKGFWHRSVVDIGLNQIQMVNYEVTGLEETLLGFGTINIQTFVGDLVIHDIHHPAKTQKKLLTILREKGFLSNAMPKILQSQEQDENE